MGCGCNKNKSAERPIEEQNRKENTMNTSQFRPPMPIKALSMAVNGAQYDNSMACYKCYIKHLSKAAVQADEVVESDGRDHEMSLCMGNIACAEDHAGALGLFNDRERLRMLRDNIWRRDANVSKELLGMAVSAIKTLREAEEKEEEAANREREERERKAREAVEAEKKEEAPEELKPSE